MYSKETVVNCLIAYLPCTRASVPGTKSYTAIFKIIKLREIKRRTSSVDEPVAGVLVHAGRKSGFLFASSCLPDYTFIS